jgi:ubiquinone biosynthesis protein COQ9
MSGDYDRQYDRQARRFAAIEAALPHVPALGWSAAALRAGAGPQADLLFPGGAAEMIETYIAFADERMVAGAAPAIGNLRLSQRVRTLIATRLVQAEGEKPAVRRALAALALPGNALVSARSLARTVDSIWAAAGDTSADFSWYTKRAILGTVYSATLLFWLNDARDHEAVLAFLDRRLAGVARLGKLRARFLPKAA